MLFLTTPLLACQETKPVAKEKAAPLTDEEKEILKDREILENLELLQNFDKVRFLDLFADRPAQKTEKSPAKPGKKKNERKQE